MKELFRDIEFTKVGYWNPFSNSTKLKPSSKNVIY